MFRIVTLSFLITFGFSANLLSAQNASSYYRKLASEQRKINTKIIMFYKTALQYTDVVRLNKSRDMVLTQLQTSLKNVERTPAYQKDSAMRNDYERVLKNYIEAFTTVYDSVAALKAKSGDSQADLAKYTDAFYYFEEMLDQAASDWLANEEYFTGQYNVRAMEDPTREELDILRGVNSYVQELRGTYTNVPYKLKEMQEAVKNKEYGELEDKRQELSVIAGDALVDAGRVGAFEFDDEMDYYLLDGTLKYLDKIMEETERGFVRVLDELDEAQYDEDERKTERAVEHLNGLIEELIELEETVQKRTEGFVAHYIEE